MPPGNCPDFSGTSEDCLYVSVMAPGEPSEDPEGYPVFFWIHGGAYTQGMGNAALYNGTTFAQNGVVTVVVNYRLGAMGFLASESMTGNYGHIDQRKALQWTQNNIAAFGGNPKRVTVGGQSAGAMSVGAHLVSPGSKGLFHQCVMESNPFGLPFHERPDAAENAKNVFEYLDCTADDVACMRTKSTDEILDAQANAIKMNFDNLFINFVPFAPLVDPAGEIPVQPFVGVQNGEFDNLPLLSGTVRDEGLMFVDELFTKPLSKTAYNAALVAIFRDVSPEVLKAYPYDIVEGTVDGRDALNIMATDLLFYCPLRNATRGYQAAASPEDTTPTYHYKFDHVLSFDCWGEGYEFCVGAVCHGSDLPFVFNVFSDGMTVDYDTTADEDALTLDMTHAWSNFIINGNPNKGKAINKFYPQYNGKGDEVLVLNEPDTNVGIHMREKYCDMWDRLGYFY